MNVSGASSATASRAAVRSSPLPKRDAKRRASSASPCSPAKRSSTRTPTLWRVSA
jgi:hypothetical protein